MLKNDPISPSLFHFHADPDQDPAFHFDADPDLDPAFTLIRTLDPAS